MHIQQRVNIAFANKSFKFPRAERQLNSKLCTKKIGLCDGEFKRKIAGIIISLQCY